MVFERPVCVAQNPCVRVVVRTWELSKVHVTVAPSGMVNVEEALTPPTTVGVPKGFVPSIVQREASSFQPAGGVNSPTEYVPVCTWMAPLVPVPFPKPSGVVVMGDTVKPTVSKLKVAVPPLLNLLTMMKFVSPMIEPLVCSPVAGTGLPRESVPWPSANQELVPRPAVKVHAKSVEAPTASVVAPPVKLAQAPPPVTFTPLSALLPVLVS